MQSRMDSNGALSVGDAIVVLLAVSRNLGTWFDTNLSIVTTHSMTDVTKTFKTLYLLPVSNEDYEERRTKIKINSLLYGFNDHSYQ